MSDDLTLEFAMQNAPNHKVKAAIASAAVQAQQDADARKLRPGEAQALQKLQRQIAESELDRKEAQINGGAQAMEQKARAASSWLHANQHTQGGSK